jgi:energy-coupling factor transporter ATP-binding protein EcfA2
VITEIKIEGFKSLEKVNLKLGGLNLFVGANASGKSNFFDALRVLQGIGYGFTIDEILNGKPKSAGSEVWDGIRGGSSLAGFSGHGQEAAQRSCFSVVMDLAGIFYRYSVCLALGDGLANLESLEKAGGELLQGLDGSPGGLSSLIGENVRSELAPLHEVFLRALSNMQRVDLSVPLLRDYSQARTAPRLGERGENFAALVQAILSEEPLKSAYVSWLRQLTPVELDDVTTLKGALGEPLFTLREGGHDRPAPILSDGTLRFAAIAAAFFQPDMPGIITLEEIENGIHPSRLRLLLELLKSQSGGPDRPGPQVFATTHSPVVLSWLEESDATTFLCKRDKDTGASIIKPLSEIPHLVELVTTQPIGDLFAEGWLEAAL